MEMGVIPGNLEGVCRTTGISGCSNRSSFRVSFVGMPDLVHLALVQLKPRKGDYPANLERLRSVFEQVDGLTPQPTVLCLAESALTGYFLEGGVRDNAVTAGTLAVDLDTAYRDAVASPARRHARLLRNLEQQAVQQCDVRHTGRG